MKETVLIIGALALSTLVAKALDVRVIGGKSVNLQPIHEWEEGGKQGQRPLKHWKEIEIVGWRVRGPQGHAVTTIRVENTEARHVYLKNCPKPILEDMARITELEQQEAAAQEQANLAALWAGSVERSRAGQGYVLIAADQRYIDWLTAREYALANAGTIAESLQRSADKIASDLSQLRKRLSQEKILAMDTGLLYGSDPVWDTGLAGR